MSSTAPSTAAADGRDELTPAAAAAAPAPARARLQCASMGLSWDSNVQTCAWQTALPVPLALPPPPCPPAWPFAWQSIRSMFHVATNGPLFGALAMRRFLASSAFALVLQVGDGSDSRSGRSETRRWRWSWRWWWWWRRRGMLTHEGIIVVLMRRHVLDIKVLKSVVKVEALERGCRFLRFVLHLFERTACRTHSVRSPARAHAPVPRWHCPRGPSWPPAAKRC